MAHIYSIHGIVPAVAPSAFVHPSAVLIGDVIVGAGCYIGPCASLRGDFGRLILEPGSNLQDCCVMHSFPGEDAVIGASGHVGHGAVLHGCRIGERALVGMNAVVMDGARVGEDAIIGAMAFVGANTEVPARHLAVGAPARVVRPLSEQEVAWKDDGIRAYQELARRSLASLRVAEPLAAPEPNRPRIPVEKFEPLYRSRRLGRGESKVEGRGPRPAPDTSPASEAPPSAPPRPPGSGRGGSRPTGGAGGEAPE